MAHCSSQLSPTPLYFTLKNNKKLPCPGTVFCGCGHEPLHITNCACTHTYSRALTHTHMLALAHMHPHLHAPTRSHAHTHTYTCAHVHALTQEHTRMHVHTRVQMHTHTYCLGPRAGPSLPTPGWALAPCHLCQARRTPAQRFRGWRSRTQSTPSASQAASWAAAGRMEAHSPGT